MNPAKSLFHAFALRLAERLTRDSPQPDAAYLAMVSTIYSMAADACGGEWVYIPHGNPVERHQARERIVLAIEAGEKPAHIAQREGVTPRMVRKLRQRGTIGP